MKQNRKSYLILWIGLFLGVVSSFLYFLFKLRENKKDLSTAFVNKYINISEEEKPKVEIQQSIPTKKIDTYKKDNLTTIKGIGPAIEKLLNENDINTFKDLTLAKTDDLKKILNKKNLRLADPTTWPEQAKQYLNNQK
jgi:predicted flap endonuclease-1-like 5' DNA nuclease